LALDYRDILNSYQDPLFKKIYTGAKLLIRNHIGFATGYYQGIPSFGVRLDLWVIKFGFTAYGRELGDYVGERQRNLYIVYTTLGW
jgi:hypothetical protein